MARFVRRMPVCFCLERMCFLSNIQCGMFKGTTRAVFVDKRDYEGALWGADRGSTAICVAQYAAGCAGEGAYRKDIYELPADSVRELIINAVMNCNFLQASHVRWRFSMIAWRSRRLAG